MTIHIRNALGLLVLLMPFSNVVSAKRCGCSSCDDSVLNRDAAGYSVVSRIDWVKRQLGQTEEEACDLVCNQEFPTVCSECAPGKCEGTCGGGNRGNGICEDGRCCSGWGWCGTSSVYCNSTSTSPSPPSSAPAPTPTPIFEEDFNDGLLDASKWSYDFGDGSQFGLVGWGNGEQQFYVEHPDIVEVSDGTLKINLLRREDYAGSVNSNLPYVSGKLKTKSKFSFTYGRVEARLRLSSALPGLFPAFWMLPENNKYGIWPHSGEIDIFEYNAGFQGKTMPQSLHFGERHAGNAISFDTGATDPTRWATYGVEWNEDSITFYYNGRETGTYRKPANSIPYNWPYDDDFYLIINLAAEPSFSNLKLPADFEKATMEVDWIRVTE